MARKGNQQKNGIDCNSSNHKKRVSDSGSSSPGTKGQAKVVEVKVGVGEEVTRVECIGNEKKSKQRSPKFLKNENQGVVATDNLPQKLPNGSNLEDGIDNTSTAEASDIREENETLPSSNNGKNCAESRYCCSQNGLHAENGMKMLDFSDFLVGSNLRCSAISTLKAAGEWMNTMVSGTLRASALLIMKASADWLERQKPLFLALATNILKACDYAQIKFEQAYPIVLRHIIHFGNIMLLILMVWLDCTLRGIDSFLRLGTTSIFSVIWCSILSVIALSGIFKFLMVLIMAALIGAFVGLTLAILVISISGTVLLWLYGSFWTTVLVIFIAGLAFFLSHERLALLVTTMYSSYCVWTYNGWTGLLFGLNLSFISSDVLVYFLKNNLNEHRRPNGPQDQTASRRSRPGFFYDDPMHSSSSEMGSGQSSDRNTGVPSTSGVHSETSEDEVLRLLNCTDHYSALGLSRFETIDASLLKREYKKKAMLVHPDKNMGNEKAAEAFKKLQNAYEVLLDSLKRQAYDDELRREELLNYFRRFQSASPKHGVHGLFASGFARSEADGKDLLEESRQIACKRCANFHIWVHTKKSKSRARWCQDCKDFHQAKDGDGWVEQHSQPFFFGLLQKVDSPSAYICAESRVYDATDWYICQGMRCPANTHKPSFHVNTSITSKPSGRATNSGHKKGGVPGFNVEESMTEEEILEWLHNAMQAGTFGASDGSPSAKAESCSKGSGSNSGSKKKKKGKKK